VASGRSSSLACGKRRNCQPRMASVYGPQADTTP
jgi:hypothetical protein